MRKYFTLLILFVGITSVIHGQSLKTFSDDFESYSNGAWLAQSSTVWDTWSGGTGNDDVKVTTSDAYSGSKSIYFNAGPGPEDVVLPFGGLHEEGQFLYRHMMKIPSGKSAYFNFQGAASIGTTWAVEITFSTTGTITFSNLTSGTMFSCNYPQGKWFEVKIYVNLTRNEWNIFIDEEFQGSFSNSVNRVSFLDLYPIDQNSSFWVDDVSFIYAPPVPNNAGVEILTSPTNANCGINNVKARIVNNGTNKLDSVRVHWSVDGKLQTPVKLTSAIDTSYSTAGHSKIVTLDSTLALSLGRHVIKVWTSHPNGKADTINFDDTLVAKVDAEIRGVGLLKAFPFQGTFGQGTATSPDTMCVGDTIAYGVKTPNGYTNADLGTGWVIKSIQMKSNGVAPVDTLTMPPSGKADFRLRYIADTSEANDIFKVDISISIGPNGCDTTLSRYIYVSPHPHVAFSAGDTCLGELVVFTNKSTGGNANKYLWKFGDNTNSRFMNTAKLYTNPGTYNVSLQATAPSGCKATAYQDVTIHEIPETAFNFTDQCLGNSISFTDASTLNNGTIAGYLWEFGDGDTAQSKNANHLYSAEGTYTVRLTVTSAGGCSKRISKKANIYAVPNAAFGAINSCDKESVAFNDSTVYSGSDALSYNWNFGDNNQSTADNPLHTYGSAGTYSVQLKVISTNGCADSITSAVEVYSIPSADFVISNTCLGQTTAFTNSSTIGTGTIENYRWDLGNGNVASTK
ncbi:MAG: PKD domain-containing protein, partial [Bacteroidetes bacterium]|nr:PKD domain-containing protein [Bacteroidota bacterium]